MEQRCFRHRGINIDCNLHLNASSIRFRLNVRYEEHLVDQLFNSTEERLARMLLLLAHFGKEGTHEIAIPRISQETLAEMVGTTRSRVSFFMNRVRKLGFIDYHAGDALQVHSSLLNVVLHD
jgi:CRP/FNR family cyclic AMP-dependent transcriptional regulator